MQRVAIIGCGGAGKSTFAARLGPILGLPVFHLDGLFWRPGWVETPRDEWIEIQRNLIKGDKWVIDGNYGGTMEIRLAAADTIIMFDYPSMLCTYRAIKRVVTYRGRSRPDNAEGCPERLDWDFLKWIWTYRSRKRPGVLALLKQYEVSANIVILKSPQEADMLLKQAATKSSEVYV